MHIDNNFLLGLFGMHIICCITGYFFIRNIIWSIVWCDKGGKYNSLKKLKYNRSLWDIISMKYLEDCIRNYEKTFKFWLLVKKIYVISECSLTGIYFLLSLIGKDTMLFQVFMIIITLQSVIVSLVLLLQTDINRNTKYDRIRIKKRNK